MKSEMKIINLHNYEEFFLMYADDELSAIDKQTVEEFVQSNPGLADELDIFLQMQLPLDAIAFDDKDVLYRNESTEINLNNYGEHILLYVDNELDNTAKNKVEIFVLQHPSLQDEFTLLKQTRLESETILFPYKQSLYRKEEKEKRVIYLRWNRIAVAAAMIGLAVLVWTLVPNSNTPEQPLAKLNTVNKITHQKSADVLLNNIGNNAKKSDKTISNSAAALPSIKKNNRPQESAPLKNTQPLMASNDLQPLSVELKKTEMTIAQAAPLLIISSNNTQRVTEGKTTLENITMITPDKNIEQNNASNSIVKPAVYKELDTEDDKKSLYLGSIEINKDKLRGFFRKASSLFRGKDRQQHEDEKSTVTPVTNTQSLK